MVDITVHIKLQMRDDAREAMANLLEDNLRKNGKYRGEKWSPAHEAFCKRMASMMFPPAPLLVGEPGSPEYKQVQNLMQSTAEREADEAWNRLRDELRETIEGDPASRITVEQKSGYTTIVEDTDDNEGEDLLG